MFTRDRLAQAVTAAAAAAVLATLSIGATVAPARTASANASWIASAPFGA